MLFFVCLFVEIEIFLPISKIVQQIDQKPHGAVATDHADCSRIGTNLLQEGGNAIDAAVAATICMGVVGPHKTGLGG